MLFERGSKVLFIGDSITDCGRGRPVGEGFLSLGDGYVSQINALIGATYPLEAIRIVNMGVSGNQVRHLEARWQEDVLGQKPDYLSIMIGINDIWRQFDLRLIPEEHVYIEEYKETLEALVKKTRPAVKGMILMTPFFLELNKADGMRAQIDRYAAAVRDIASRYDAIFVDVQARFDALLKDIHSYAFSNDRVHPNGVGSMVIARAFLNAVGYEWK